MDSTVKHYRLHTLNGFVNGSTEKNYHALKVWGSHTIRLSSQSKQSYV